MLLTKGLNDILGGCWIENNYHISYAGRFNCQESCENVMSVASWIRNKVAFTEKI